MRRSNPSRPANPLFSLLRALGRAGAALALIALAAFVASESVFAAAGSTVIRASERAAQTSQAPAVPASGSGNLLAAGTPYATRYYVQDSGIPGPTVMIVGGMHGNEPAGYTAARKFIGRKPARGKLIVIPEVNVLGIRAGTRTGDHPGDPNRDYPRSRNDQPDTPLARDIWNLVKRERPDYLLDLHEGYDFHRINSASVGQSIIYYPTDGAAAAAKAMQTAVNRTIKKPNHRFSLLKYPIQGSLARAAGRDLKVKAMILETSRRQPLQTRVDQHVTMVEALLDRLQM